jgi:hypothetical protein
VEREKEEVEAAAVDIIGIGVPTFLGKKHLDRELRQGRTNDGWAGR